MTPVCQILTFALKMASFNCENLQTSHDEVNSLCEENDIVCLQKSWLAKNELNLLSNINIDFLGNGILSIDDENRINTSRPFGGTGIMWRKHLNVYSVFKTYDCDRIIGLEINCTPFSLLILCIYLPFDGSENVTNCRWI